MWQRDGGPVHSGLEFGMRGGTIPKHCPQLGLAPTKVPNVIARLGTLQFRWPAVVRCEYQPSAGRAHLNDAEQARNPNTTSRGPFVRPGRDGSRSIRRQF